MVNEDSVSAGKSFHGQDEAEVYEFSTRQHWIRIFWPSLRMTLVSAAVLLFGWFVLFAQGVDNSSSRHGILFGLMILLLVVQWRWLMRIYTYFLYAIIITDRRVHRVKKTLMMVDDHQTVDIWTLQDIHKSQHGILQNLLGYGTILLESQDTKLRLHFIPHVNENYKKIAHLRELARERYLPSPISRTHTKSHPDVE